MPKPPQVANPGSTLGKAVGALVEKEVNRLMRPIAEEYGCVYVTAKPPNPRTGLATKITFSDALCNQFQVNAAVASRRMQPLMLIDSKCLFTTDNSHDEADRIGATYDSLRCTYPTIRQSVVVLAGIWSAPAIAVMQDSNVTLFEIALPVLTSVLSTYKIPLVWNEVEQDRAREAAWLQWTALNDSDYDTIARLLFTDIALQLCETTHKTLTTKSARRT